MKLRRVWERIKWEIAQVWYRLIPEREYPDRGLILARRILHDWAFACRFVERHGIKVRYVGRGYGRPYPAWEAMHHPPGNHGEGGMGRTPLEAVAECAYWIVDRIE